MSTDAELKGLVESLMERIDGLEIKIKQLELLIAKRQLRPAKKHGLGPV